MNKVYSLTFNVTFLQDLTEAIDWYDEISVELGTKFLNTIWITEEKIVSTPNAFGKVSKSLFRSALLKTFPYKIYFRVEGDVILIIALIHTSRSNKFINQRLK